MLYVFDHSLISTQKTTEINLNKKKTNLDKGSCMYFITTCNLAVQLINIA